MLDEIIYDIVDDSNEEESHESDGRNLDYGHEKSDSHEGSTAKKALLTMAKDLYHLYVTLNDSDDLPEWCHYKLATSRKDLSDVTDYITSKILKHCLDNKIDHEGLQEAIKLSMKDQLNEGMFSRIKDFFTGKKTEQHVPFEKDMSFSGFYVSDIPQIQDFVRLVDSIKSINKLFNLALSKDNNSEDITFYMKLSNLAIDKTSLSKVIQVSQQKISYFLNSNKISSAKISENVESNFDSSYLNKEEFKRDLSLALSEMSNAAKSIAYLSEIIYQVFSHDKGKGENILKGFNRLLDECNSNLIKISTIYKKDYYGNIRKL